ncbi:DNA-binding protein [Neptuniibacter marinus]|uniref:DNA-binding protein n=1 Tax=Neptuniibacter marinus TaxID=1806670 RepID=UPI00082DE749|nr:DNA-binding protein [Neptuniibacter marinus]
MAKKSDTQEFAKKTADILLQEGIRPTQQNVRERMGCGSITTINKALNAWWQELGERLKVNTSHPMLPDPVAESASKLWLQALAYAEKELEVRRDNLEREYREKINQAANSSKADNSELKELRSQCLRLLQENEKCSDQKLALQGKLFEQENTLIALQAKSEALERELKQKQIMSKGTQDIDEYIEIQVNNRTLKEENKRLNKQIELLISDKSSLQMENIQLNAEVSALKQGIS